MKRTLRYIKGTLNVGICFPGSEPPNLHALSDSDSSGHMKDCIFTNAFRFYMAAGATGCSSRKERFVATYTCDAEYISLLRLSRSCVALTQIIWRLQNWIHGMIVFSDRHNAIKLAGNESTNQRNKNDDITLHYDRDVVIGTEIQLEFRPSIELTSSLLTKTFKTHCVPGLCCPCRDVNHRTLRSN